MTEKTVWIAICPACGPVRIESELQPERCKVRKGKLNLTCQQPLQSVRQSRTTTHNRHPVA